MAKKLTDGKIMKTVKLSPELLSKIEKKADKVKRSTHYMMVECLEKGFK